MSVFEPMQQAGTPAPQPPIPPMPSAPGAGTGGRVIVEPVTAAGGAAQGGANQGAPSAAEAQRNAEEAARNAQAAIENAIQASQNAVQGTTTTTGFPVDPEAILEKTIPIVGMSLAMIVVLFIGWPLARAWARRMDRRLELEAVRASDLQPQIRQLQESLDTMAIELERISEAQRFQAKLMSERGIPLPSEARKG